MRQTLFTHSIIGLSIWLLGFLFAAGLNAAPPEGYAFHSYGDALKLARESGKPVFLYFGRYGCSSCRKTHKETFTDNALKQRLEDHYILAYADTESGERLTLPSGERITEMQLASRSRIIGTPTYLFLSPDETPIFKFAGFKTVKQMEAYDDYVHQGHYREKTFKEFLASNQ